MRVILNVIKIYLKISLANVIDRHII